MQDKNHFTIQVNNRNYFIKPIHLKGDAKRFEVSTNSAYMFTLCTDEYHDWQMENDVTPLYRTLVEQIGTEIEFHDA